MTINVFNADCLEWLRQQPDDSIDSIVTDPPYGLSNTKPAQVVDVLAAWVRGEDEAVPTKRGGFMGKDWDSFVPPPAAWKECMRVLKPGGHMAVFAGARTQDLMGMSIRLAGFEIRDNLGWIYGSGFPKSHNISKAIDKAAGVEFSASPASGVGFMNSSDDGWNMTHNQLTRTGESTPEAQRWDGWGTALKPAIEPIILARKPLDGTVAGNVLAHGVGGLNIDASRVPPTSDYEGKTWEQGTDIKGGNFVHGTVKSDVISHSHPTGRFPANVLLDDHAAKEMDEQSGVSVSRANTKSDERGAEGSHIFASASFGRRDPSNSHNDSGGASRFFPVFKYQAKAPKRERPVIEREDGTKIQHPTVKPVALMEWLVTLITPPNGLVLDPFAGSGTTLQAARNKGFNAIGIEAEKDYIELINQRLNESETQCAN